MAQFDENRLRNELDTLAKPAKSDLAWVAAYHVFFKTWQQHAPASASAILVHPEQSIGVPVQQFPSLEGARRAWQQAVQALHGLRGCAMKQARDDPGHYLNKAAVVYAVALVEGFLSDAHNKTLKAAYGQDPQREGPKSVRSFVAVLEGLYDHRGNRKKGYKKDEYPENQMPWARDALLLAEIRHAVVHRQGKADCRFRKAVGWQGDAEHLWDDAIWPDRQAFERDFINPPDRKDPNEAVQVCLDVTKVIIPYVPKCVAFVDACVGKLIDAAKGWPDSP